MIKRDTVTGILSDDVSTRDCRIQLYYKGPYKETERKGKYATIVMRPAEYVLKLGYMDGEYLETPQYTREYQISEGRRPNLMDK